MKTTVELPEELMRALKIRAVNEGSRLKDVMADVVRRGLAQPSGPLDAASKKVHLPLIDCAHDALADEETTPERMAELLLQEEAQSIRDAVR